MATTTRLEMLQLVSEALHDYWSKNSTGAGSTTTIVDTKLLTISGGDEDFCVDQWVRNVATGEIALVSGYANATGTVTHGAITAVGAAAAYELHRIDPQLKLDAIKRASVLCFPQGIQRGLYDSKPDESLRVDNLLLNSGGEVFATTFTSWTHTVATWTQEATRKIHGTYSFKGVASGGAAQLTQNLFTSVNIHDIAGKTITLKGWVWASAASTARLRVTFDGGSTFYSSDYHAGSSEWESPRTVKVQQAVPTDATSMTVYLEVADGGTAYFDSLCFSIDPVYSYTIPSTMIRGPFQVLQQNDEDDPNGSYSPIPAYGAPTEGAYYGSLA